MDLYLIVHVAWLYTSMSYASCKIVAHLVLNYISCNIVEINHFVATCDYDQTTVDYHHIYFAYIYPYRVQVATNVQLNYNYENF
jgi:hypothetical protein